MDYRHFKKSMFIQDRQRESVNILTLIKASIISRYLI